MKVLPGLAPPDSGEHVIHDLSIAARECLARHELDRAHGRVLLRWLICLLAIGQRSSCWLAAFISSVLYVWVLFGARLYMESVLNAFYAAMAVYGFWQWRHGKGGGALDGEPVAHCARHALASLGDRRGMSARERIFPAALHAGGHCRSSTRW